MNASTNPEAPSVTGDEQLASLIYRLGMIVFGLVCVGVASLYRKRYGAPLPERTGSALDAVSAWAAGFVVAFAVFGLVSATAGALPWMDYSSSTSLVNADYEYPWVFVAMTVLSGFVEEPLLAALPVLLLVGRFPIVWIVVLGGLMRGVLHIYYGVAGFAWAFVWGAAAVWVYYRYRRLWVLVLYHGLVLNISAVGDAPGAPAWVWVVTTVLVKFGLMAALALYWMHTNPRWWRKALDHLLPSHADGRVSVSAENDVE